MGLNKAISDPAAQLDFPIRKGVKLDKTLTAKDGNDVNYDFTGHTATFKLYDKPGGTEVSGINATVTLTSGSIQIEIIASETDTLDIDEYYGELEINDGTDPYIWTSGICPVYEGINPYTQESTSLTISPGGNTVNLTISTTGGASSLSELSDVTSAATNNGFALIADGSKYVGRAIVEADISNFGSYANASHTHMESDISDLGNYLSVDAGSYTVTPAWTLNGGDDISQSYQAADVWQIEGTWNNGGSSYGRVKVLGQDSNATNWGIIIDVNDATNGQAFLKWNESSTTFTDTRSTTRGIEYGGDYSAGFQTHTLVTKDWTESNFLGLSGGTLTGNVTFSTADTELRWVDSDESLRVNSSGQFVFKVAGSDRVNINSSYVAITSTGAAYMRRSPSATRMAFGFFGDDGTGWRRSAAGTFHGYSDSTIANRQIVTIANDGFYVDNGILKLPTYTVATLPTAVAQGVIYVSDETGGATMAFSDGTSWYRVQDRAVVS